MPRGELVSLSRKVGSHPPDVFYWANGIRPVPIIRAVAIERATEGLVTRRDLRPSDWHLIWPELADGSGISRPVVGVEEAKEQV